MLTYQEYLNQINRYKSYIISEFYNVFLELFNAGINIFSVKNKNELYIETAKFFDREFLDIIEAYNKRGYTSIECVEYLAPKVCEKLGLNTIDYEN